MSGMAEFEQPGGRDAAPGELALVQAFLNTLDREGGEEVLETPELLGRWLRKRRLLDAGERVHDPADLDRARALREALRAALRHRHEDGAPGDLVEQDQLDPSARATIEHAADRARFSLASDHTGTVTLTPRADGVDGALGRLLAICLRAQVDGGWSRLRVCANDVCQWAFYDASRNRSGRWCSMAICGNRSKVRTHRGRYRQEGDHAR